MQFPLDALIECSDGVCGRLAFVLINPVIEQVTHLVVKLDAEPNPEYIVPNQSILKTTPEKIFLRCTKEDLGKLEPFIKTTFVEEVLPGNLFLDGIEYGHGMAPYYFWPYSSFKRIAQIPKNIQQVPAGELAIRRGTRVEATDGFVGKVDEFVVNPKKPEHHPPGDARRPPVGQAGCTNSLGGHR